MERLKLGSKKLGTDTCCSHFNGLSDSARGFMLTGSNGMNCLLLSHIKKITKNCFIILFCQFYWHERATYHSLIQFLNFTYHSLIQFLNFTYHSLIWFPHSRIFFLTNTSCIGPNLANEGLYFFFVLWSILGWRDQGSLDFLGYYTV